MKSFGIFLAVLFALLFIIITIQKGRRSPTEEDVEKSDSGESDRKKEIKRFWDTYHLADEKRVQGERIEAIALYREALTIDPNHENSHYFFGTLLAEEGDYEEALTSLRKVVEVNPSSSRAHSQLGFIFSTPLPGAPLDLVKARQEFERCIEINREETGPFFNLGKVSLSRGENEDALDHFESVTKLNYKNVKAYRLSGLVKIRQGKHEEAFHLFEKALELGKGEKPIKGVPGEGATKKDTLLAALREGENLLSLFSLYWTAQRLGGYPEETPEEFRIELPSPNSSPFTKGGQRGIFQNTEGGRGCAWGDYDGDGDPDLAVVGLNKPLTLSINDGNGNFSRGVLPYAPTGWDLVWADIDGDLDLDLYLLKAGWIGKGENVLYRNEGVGATLAPASPAGGVALRPITEEAGLAGERGTAKAVFFDMDNDGDLDLLEVGGTIRLFKNQRGVFQDVTVGAGFTPAQTSTDCTVGDYDGDGKLDLFILYWNHPGRLYKNTGKGRFQDVTVESGIFHTVGAVGLRRIAPALSALFFDYNNDNRLDLLIATHAPYEDALACLLNRDLKMETNIPLFFHNNGDGTFRDVASEWGLGRCHGTMDVAPLDYNSDGWTDLYLATGGLEIDRQEPDLILKNTGKGYGEIYLLEEGFPGKSLKASPADFDGDGDIDLYISRGGILPGDRWDDYLYVNLSNRF